MIRSASWLQDRASLADELATSHGNVEGGEMIADLKRGPEIWRLPPQPGDELLGEASLIEEKNGAAWGMTWGVDGREEGPCREVERRISAEMDGLVLKIEELVSGCGDE